MTRFLLLVFVVTFQAHWMDECTHRHFWQKSECEFTKDREEVFVTKREASEYLAQCPEKKSRVPDEVWCTGKKIKESK